MYDTPRTIEEIIAILAGTPVRLADLSAGLSPDQLVASPEPGEWSARDILAHLHVWADIWGGYILTILSQDRPTFNAVDPDAWTAQVDYLEQEFQPSLHAFTAQRRDLLAVLEPLPREAWSRSGTVIAGGEPHRRTVHIYALWLANHEHEHYPQLEGIASRFARPGFC